MHGWSQFDDFGRLSANPLLHCNSFCRARCCTGRLRYINNSTCVHGTTCGWSCVTSDRAASRGATLQ